MDDLDYLETQCTEGMYQALVNFTYGTDVDIAYQDVAAKMGTILNQLPDDSEPPITIKADPSQLSVVDLAVTSDSMGLRELRTWVENYLQDQFTGVAGTAGTEVTGGLEREIRVHLDQDALQAMGLTVSDVSRALAADNVQLLGGWVTGPRKEHVARTLAEYTSMDSIRSTVVAKDPMGSPVFLGDIAQVADSSATQRLKTVFGGQECVKLSVYKQNAANTMEVASNIRQKVDELAGMIPEGVRIASIYDASEYVIRAVASVRDAALIAGLLVVLVTAFFLTGWQRILVVSITLPLSMLAAFFGAHLLGFSINIFSLGGLVVAITVLLDNCVVVMENITRLQTEHPEEPHPVRTGVTQVSGAVTAATITFLALFLPFLMVPGLASLLFSELIILIALIIVISLVLALTVTPCLLNLFFPEGSLAVERRGPVAQLSHRVIQTILRRYEPLLRFSLRRPQLILIATAALFVAGLASARLMGSEFLPRVDDGYVIAKVKMPTGTSVQETDRVLARIEEALADVPDVKQTFRLTGGRVWGLVTYEIPNEGEVDIELKPAHSRRLTTDQWVEKYGPQITKASMVPGARIKVMHMKMRGIRQTGEFPVEIELRAPRTEPLEKMAQVASKVRGTLKDVPGLAKLDVSLDVSKPEFQVRIDHQTANDLGLSVSDVARTIRTFVDGIVPTRYHEGGYYYDIRVRLKEGLVSERSALEQLVMPGPGGSTYVLGDIWEVVPAVGPTQVDRYDQMRIIKVTADTAGVSAGVANSRAAKALRVLSCPLAIPCVWARRPGDEAELPKPGADPEPGYVLRLCRPGHPVRIVLASIDHHDTRTAIARGRFLALALTLTPLGITVLIGVVVLAGIEVNHGVVLLGYIRQLEEGHGSAGRDHRGDNGPLAPGAHDPRGGNRRPAAPGTWHWRRHRVVASHGCRRNWWPCLFDRADLLLHARGVLAVQPQARLAFGGRRTRRRVNGDAGVSDMPCSRRLTTWRE